MRQRRLAKASRTIPSSGLSRNEGVLSSLAVDSHLASKASDYKIIVRYRPAEGGPKTDYYLVRTEKGLAVLERDQGGSSALANLHCRASDGDHFALWISFLSR